MGNSKTKPEVEKTLNNLGLINFEENNLGTMRPFEIAIVILLFLGVLVLCRYCHQRCKKSGMRAMNTAVQEGMSRATGNATNTAVGVPMITFEQPGTRMVAMQPTTATAPSAPMQLQPPNKTMQTSAGLWEQCR